MQAYWILALGLNFLVDLLLMVAVSRVLGHGAKLGRYILGALLGVGYGTACVAADILVLESLGCRLLCLALMGGIGFGFSGNAVGKILLFVVMNLAFCGISMGNGSGLLAALLVLLICRIGRSGELIEVELHKGDALVRLLALRDNGNRLFDPVTGKGILVADAESADALLGLSRAQLADPVGTVASGILPGLRLIPYRAVGVSKGLLLAMKLDRVRIGNRWEETVVAFAPEGLGGESGYRALLGGIA